MDPDTETERTISGEDALRLALEIVELKEKIAKKSQLNKEAFYKVVRLEAEVAALRQELNELKEEKIG